jgi:2-polyprenyl-6-methoxyphenol hydroxylase-like FAD-dependent oxidoreductase
MSEIVVIGGGVGGLTTALLLAGDGHAVTVLERDPAPPPADAEDAWAAWERRGVNQFRLLHFFTPRFRKLIDAEMPALASALDAAGALRFNAVALIPDEFKGGSRPGDEEFEALTARRPVFEAALSATAASTPGITIRRGASVEGLLTAGQEVTGAPHVVGVRIEGGDELRADLIVDASGRRSALPRLLTDIGARPPEEELEDAGFVYYGRHFSSGDGSVPALMGGLLTAAGSVSLLTLPADNGTWGVGIIAGASDAALRGLKDNDRWMAALRTFPLQAHWVDGEPLDDVAVMAKIEDRHRSFVIDGTPVATGVVAIADSWACTNPSLGRGATMGAMHALELRNVLRDVPADDAALAAAFHDRTMETVEPWYRATLEFDNHRIAEVDAAARGEQYEPGDPVWEITQAMQSAAGKDGDVLRGFLSIVSMLRTNDEVIGAPGFLDRVISLGGDWRDDELLVPSRDELVKIATS